MLHKRTMVRSARCWLLATALATVAAAPASAAAPQTGTEERFQDLFVTAGYCTAFGAALGTAFLAFTPNPAENLRFVAVGASLGFISGSALGSYIIFSPLVVSDQSGGYRGSLASEGPLPARGLVIRPTMDTTRHQLHSIEGGMTLAQF